LPRAAETYNIGMPSPAQNFFEVALLGMLTSGFLAVLGSGELDTPTVAIMSAALLLRALMIAGVGRPQIPSALVTALAAGYFLFYAADYAWLSRSFVAATVHMLFFVAVVKIVTASTLRDFLYLKLIAGLELLAAALLSTELSFFFYLAAFVLCAIGAFAGGEVLRSMGQNVRVSRLPPRAMHVRLSLMAASLFCGILVITAALFFVLPRTARAAFQRFVPQRYHVPGFGSEVTLGEIGELKQNSTAVMHVRSYEDAPLLALRWRGSALSHFDGKRWFNPPVAEQRLPVSQGQLLLPAVRQTRPGRNLRYAVELSSIASDTLYFAGTPQSISIQALNLFRSPSGAIRAPRFGMAGLRYGADSRVENEWAAPLEPIVPLDIAERRALLELPQIDARVAALAKEWTAGEINPEKMARAVETHFHKDFRYTLEMLETEVPDPLAYFLFVRKKGHCEYFASSMAVMLRTLGVPSRVATGFLGGVYNPLSGWQVVRASDAHSWVEAWIPGRGWMTFDPTPADPSATDPSAWTSALNRGALVLDAADQFWRDWVLTYDLDHQVALAARMQSAGRGWNSTSKWTMLGDAAAEVEDSFSHHQLAWVVGVGAFGACAMAMIYGSSWLAWWRRRQRLKRAQRGEAEASDATLLYERMLMLLRTRGFEKPAWLTPQEFVGVLPASELALLVEDLTAAYNQVRFGGRRDAAPRMARLLRRIETLVA
jgi:protein-glutamine gamma-glutamyltransferase